MGRYSSNLAEKSVVEEKPWFQKNNRDFDGETIRGALDILCSNIATQKEWAAVLECSAQYVGQLIRGEKPIYRELAEEIIFRSNLFLVRAAKIRQWAHERLCAIHGRNAGYGRVQL